MPNFVAAVSKLCTSFVSSSSTPVIRPGAIPPSMIPIPAHLFDSDSSHLGYDCDSDSDSNTIFMNDSDSDSSTTYILIVTPELYKF